MKRNAWQYLLASMLVLTLAALGGGGTSDPGTNSQSPIVTSPTRLRHHREQRYAQWAGQPEQCSHQWSLPLGVQFHDYD